MAIGKGCLNISIRTAFAILSRDVVAILVHFGANCIKGELGVLVG